MTRSILTLEEAGALTVEVSAMRLLAPEDIARNAIVPIALDDDRDRAVIVVDAASRDPEGRMLRMIHGVTRVESLLASRETIELLLGTWYQPYWEERGWVFPGLPERNPEGEPAEEPAATPAGAEPEPSPDNVEETYAKVFDEPPGPDALSIFDEKEEETPVTDRAAPGESPAAVVHGLGILDEIPDEPEVTAAPVEEVVAPADMELSEPPVSEAREPDPAAETPAWESDLDQTGAFVEEDLQVPSAPPTPAEPPAPAATHPAVLLVEDDDRMRDALCVLLDASGYETRVAATKEAAENEINRSPPQFVTSRRNGPLPEEALLPLVRKANAKSEVRVHADYAAAILSAGQGDERVTRFLFDVTSFFCGVIAGSVDAPGEAAEVRTRYAERTARRLGLPPAEIEATRFAAILYDLPQHLSKLRPSGAGQSDGNVLVSLLDPVRAPFPVGEILSSCAERFDGSGPQGREGEAIPIGARILAAVERFTALREEFPDTIESDVRLRDEAGQALDPGVVEAVLRADQAERLVESLEQSLLKVVLVEPDPAAASLVRMRLVNAGFNVEVHREGPAALESIEAAPPSLVVSEVAVPGVDGFTLLLRMKKSASAAEVPFLFLSERLDRGTMVRGLGLGADDFLGKPVDLELLAAKVKSLVRKGTGARPAEAPQGVTGDLSEMELVDLLQVLAASARTVCVRVDTPGKERGELALAQGRVVDARIGETVGADAFNRLIARDTGRFEVESKEPPENRTIDAPLESLLLEACRIRDEAERMAVET